MPSIPPEFWKYIPFGENIDFYGGRARPTEGDQLVTEFTEADTSRGKLMMRFVGESFNVIATDLGIGLLYGKEGLLETVGVDIIEFLNQIDRSDLQEAGEDDVYHFVERMLANRDRLYFSIEMKDKTVALANINEGTGKREVLFAFENMDFSKHTLITANYDGFSVFFNLGGDEDEFEFGLIAKGGKDVPYKKGTDFLMVTLLSDLNLRTFLDSKTEDKFEKLAKRIFIN